MTYHLTTLCGCEQWIKNNETYHSGPPVYYRVPIRKKNPASDFSLKGVTWGYRLFELDTEGQRIEDWRKGLYHYREVPS